MSVHLRFRRCRWISPEKISIAVRKVHDEEVGLLLGAFGDDDGFAGISERRTWRVGQRHKQLLASPFELANVSFGNRVASRKPMVVPKPLEYPLGREALLATDLLVSLKQSVNDLREPVQLRSLDWHLPAIIRRR